MGIRDHSIQKYIKGFFYDCKWIENKNNNGVITLKSQSSCILQDGW